MPRPARRPRLEQLEDRTTPTAGQLDPTFDGDGRQLVPYDPLTNTYDFGYAVAVVPGGGVVIGGTTADAFTANTTAAAVVKLTAAGAPDPTFGTNGRVTFSFSPGDPTAVSRVVAVAALPDGKVLVGGSVYRPVSEFGTNHDFAVARLTADGLPDPTFGTNGRTVIPFDLFAFPTGENEDIARGMAVDSQGRILLVGNVSAGEMAFRTFGAARLTPSGQLDTTFDGDGRVVVAFPASFAEAVPEDVAIGPNGRVVLAGWARPWSNLRYDLAAVALTPEGQLDTTFDGDGRWVYGLDFGGDQRDVASAVRVDPAGRVVLAGEAEVSGMNADAVVVRLLPSGQLDAGFNGTGVVRLGFDRGSGNYDTAKTVLIDPAGRVVVAGGTQAPDAGGQFATDFFVTRLLPGGGADPAFGTGGTAVVDFTPVSGDPTDSAADVDLDAAGRVVVAGSAFRGPNTGLYDFAVARLTGDPSVNNPPTANADALTVAEDSAATTVPVLGNDSTAPDTGETLTVTAVTQPAHGAVTLTGGVVRYAPAANYNGPDSFTYTLSDGNGGTATGTVTVTVTPVNDPPAATPDALTVAEDAPATVVPVLGNDSVAPDAGETLTVSAVTQPAHGVVALVGGVVRYTPAANYSGPDTFTYIASDGNGGSAVGTVSVTVTPVNDPPTANPDAFSVARGAPAATLAVLANDSSAPDSGEALAVTAVTQPAVGGVVSVAPGVGGVVFTPTIGFVGLAAFTYTVGDGTPGSSATAAVTVTVEPAGLGPVRPVAAGGAPDGTVRLTTPAGGPSALAPFGNIGAPTRTASADVDGDGVADVIAVTGPGTRLRVAVLSGAGGRVLVQSFDPFGGDFLGGGYVAAADLDGDGRADFVVTPDEGGGPRVTVFSRTADGLRATRANFFGIDDPNFRGGARAAVGDVNGDGTPDVVVAAGFGGGPRTAVFTGQSVLAGNPTRLIADFFAFPGADATNLRNGSFVAAGDITGDGFADLVFGGGPGGAPRVFVLSGALVRAGDVAGAQASPVANFFVAGDLTDRGGARVAVTNSDGDGKADLVVGSGAGRPARVRVYLGKDFAGAGEPAATDLDPFGGAVLADGVYVG